MLVVLSLDVRVAGRRSGYRLPPFSVNIVQVPEIDVWIPVVEFQFPTFLGSCFSCVAPCCRRFCCLKRRSQQYNQLTSSLFFHSFFGKIIKSKRQGITESQLLLYKLLCATSKQKKLCPTCSFVRLSHAKCFHHEAFLERPFVLWLPILLVHQRFIVHLNSIEQKK